MRTRDFAERNIRFQKTSPVTGPFRLSQYPFLGRPMDASDDIRVKRLVIFKASSCLGTVLGQIINAKRIVCDAGDQKMVCQTDDDAALWTKTRGKEWLRSIPDAMRLLSRDKYAMTNDLWMFRHKFLEISGPGINSAQSVQVRYLQTDESHLEGYPNGRLVEFEKRMGGRFDRQATHITTAPSAGREVDSFYLEGQQDEWALRCAGCHELVLPLWHKESEARFNGHRVFHERGNELSFVCPHCGKEHFDNQRDRYALNRDGDYLSQNPEAPIETRSFQWPVWAAHWISWREMLTEYRQALEKAKLGDLSGIEDWRKKRECRSYVPELPDFGERSRSNSYKIGDVWITHEPKRRFCSFDYQEGRGGEGIHWWGQVDEYTESGNCRVIAFAKLLSWDQCRAFQLSHVPDARPGEPLNVGCDYGHRDREVFKKCAEYKWLALRSADDETPITFLHTLHDRRENKTTTISLPYSEPQIQTALGVMPKRIHVKAANGATLAPGLCVSRTWSKAGIGFLLLALINGRAGRTHGVPLDIGTEFLSQLNSYVEAIEPVKKGSLQMKRILRKARIDDHAFATSSQNLVMAAIAGFYPLAATSEAAA